MQRVEEFSNLTDEGGSSNARVLPEDQLRLIGRTLSTLIPQGSDDREPSAQVQQLRLDLLHTARSSNLSPAHGAAALNTLCGFLEICSKCQNHGWASLYLGLSTCKQLFNIFLNNSENFKPKPAKQLLITSVNALSKLSDRTERQLLTNNVVARCVKSLSDQENSKSIKSSLQCLEYFVSKNIITSKGIVNVSAGFSSAVNGEKVHTEPKYSSTAFHVAIEIFVIQVLYWVRYPDCNSAISKFIPCFFASLTACSDAEAVESADLPVSPACKLPLWIGPIKRALERDISLLESFESYVFPGLLRLSSRDTEAFLETLPLKDLQEGNVGGHTDASIQLCLLSIKMLGSGWKHADGGGPDILKTNIFDPADACINLADHSSAHVRIAAFSLLISSSSLSGPLPCKILTHLEECIPYFHQETNSRTRNQFLSSMKPLCLRLGNAAKTFSRLSAAAGQRYRHFDGASENLMHHIRLALWHWQYLLHELRPTASYQSHITSLKVLPHIVGSNVLIELIECTPEKEQRDVKVGHGYLLHLVRPLLDMLIDPFDDVRQSASSVLDLILSSDLLNGRLLKHENNVDTYSHDASPPQTTVQRYVEMALNHAEAHMRRSGRADHADGVGRLYDTSHNIGKYGYQTDTGEEKDPLNDSLLVLEQTIEAGGQNRISALMSTSLHGHLIALKYMVGHSDSAHSLSVGIRPPDIQSLYTRLLVCCSKVWQAVRDVLCSCAPEGRYLHDDDDDEADDGSKDALSFCWRALKESTLLMHTLVDAVSSPKRDLTSKLDDRDCNIYGRLIFTQLAELRHRGAFSSVAQTFAAWCIMCSNSESPGVANLPKEWYQEVLSCIYQQASTLTRRSAGLPAIITGILAAYPSGPFFDDIILDLQAIADTPTEEAQDVLHMSLAQVHALNCLKDIFTDTRFGPSTEEHMTISLGVATSSLESDIWAIRNCGLMLLKALLKRLNGGADTSSTRIASTHRQFSSATYEKFPILPGLLLRLLHYQHGDTVLGLHAQRVFPALEIVERFGVPDVHRDEILQALDYHKASPIWPIREKAAKAFGMIAKAEHILDEVQKATHVGKPSSQNKVHGQLLSLRVAFTRAMPTFLDSSNASHLRKLFMELLNLFDKQITQNACPFTVAAALNLLADMAENLAHLKDDTDVQHFIDQLKKGVLDKYATLALTALPYASARSLERNAILRFLAILQIDIGFNSGGTSQEDYSPLTDKSLTGDAQNSVGPEESDSRLRLWGRRLAEDLLQNRSSSTRFMAWIKTLFLAGNAHTDLSTRLAAVASIDNFFAHVRNSPNELLDNAIPVELMTILYDTLVDDDEDIRNQGAIIVSSIFSAVPEKHANTVSLSLSPPPARSRFLQYLSSIYGQSATLLLEAVWRLTGIASTIDVVSRIELTHLMGAGASDKVTAGNFQLEAVSTLLANALQQQSVVFEEEKQNLYLDPAMEAQDWAQLIIKMEPCAWPPGLVEIIKDWTEDGLRCLLQVLAEKGDGPLGLTSKAEVFALFTQVLSMAKTLMVVSQRHSAKWFVNEEFADMSGISTGLRNLIEREYREDLHPLILGIARRALGVANDGAK